MFATLSRSNCVVHALTSMKRSITVSKSVYVVFWGTYTPMDLVVDIALHSCHGTDLFTRSNGNEITRQ